MSTTRRDRRAITRAWGDVLTVGVTEYQGLVEMPSEVDFGMNAEALSFHTSWDELQDKGNLVVGDPVDKIATKTGRAWGAHVVNMIEDSSDGGFVRLVLSRAST